MSIMEFVAACRDNNITLARQLLDTVDINGRDSDGWTGLMRAMFRNHLPIVRMLLDHPNILVGTTDNINCTALHYACYNNKEECVRLFLAHTQCNTQIVNTVSSYSGNTAEMAATMLGYHGCARLIRDYLDNSQASSSSAYSTVNTASASSPARLPPPSPSTRPPPPSAPPGRLTLAQLAEAIESIEVEEKTFLEGTTSEITSLQKTLNEALDKQETGLAELKNRREALRAELHDRTANDNHEEEPVRNIRPPPSLIPKCPACYEEMSPPRQIYTCSNGHLICSDCRPNIRDNMCINRCRSSYDGRATAVEQMVRQILGIM